MTAHLEPGGCVSVLVGGLVRHVGIVSDRLGDDALPMVFSNSRRAGEVREETWSRFAGGRPVATVELEPARPRAEVLARARELLGRPYAVGSYNCEHYVRDCYGLEVHSPQVRRVGFVGLAVAAAAGAVALTTGGGES